MKKFSFKAVALAAGLVVGGSAFAAINLDATTPAPVLIASEATINGTTGTALTDAATFDATVALGSAIQVSTTRYIRVTLSSGTFTAAPVVTTATANDTVTLLQGGAGESYAIFSMATGAGDAAAAADVVTIAPAGITVKNQTLVTLTYGLYETQSQAANQTSPLKTATGNFIEFTAGVKTTIVSNTITADVEASPSFTKFTGAAATKALANYTVAATAGVTGADAVATTPTTVFASAKLVANGDFNAAKNDDGTFTGDALARVFIASDSGCTTSIAASTALTASKATFATITGATLTADGTNFLCLTAEGTPEIPVGDYTLDVDYTAAANHTVADITAAPAGTVNRNGVTLVAPLVNQPAGWYSRLVLSNTSTVARPYTVTAVTEAGTTIVLTGDALSGTLAASSTKVIDLASLATITGGAPRASLKVVVNGPTAHISGLYQIANGTTGMLSNYTLVQK